MKEKPTMRDWYQYHQEQVRLLKDKESLTLLESSLLKYHEFWVEDIENNILTAEQVVSNEQA